MNYGFLLTVLGIALFGLGLVERGWFLILTWLGFNFLILGIAHFRGFHAVLGKRTDGCLAWWSWLGFLPLHLSTTIVWYAIRLFSREPACSIVDEELIVGRRLLSSENKENFDNWIDLTAEFSEPESIRRSNGYFCFPILDGSAPTPEALRASVAGLRSGKTFIHCAQGHGRTGLFALAVLLYMRRAETVTEGLRILSKARPGIQLSRVQRECIELYEQQLR